MTNDSGTALRGNNILDGGRPRRRSSSGQAGVISLGLVFGLALIGLVVSGLACWKNQDMLQMVRRQISRIGQEIDLVANGGMPNRGVIKPIPVFGVGMHEQAFLFGAHRADILTLNLQRIEVGGASGRNSHGPPCATGHLSNDLFRWRIVTWVRGVAVNDPCGAFDIKRWQMAAIPKAQPDSVVFVRAVGRGADGDDLAKSVAQNKAALRRFQGPLGYFSASVRGIGGTFTRPESEGSRQYLHNADNYQPDGPFRDADIGISNARVYRVLSVGALSCFSLFIGAWLWSDDRNVYRWIGRILAVSGALIFIWNGLSWVGLL